MTVMELLMAWTGCRLSERVRKILKVVHFLYFIVYLKG